MSANETLLVTGASGHLGRAVLSHLLDTLRIAPSRVIATSRKPAELAALQARGVTVRAADYDDPATLASAFRGAARLLLISTDRLDRPGIRLAQHQAAIAAAIGAGVQHVLYTSMPKPETSRVSFAPDHAGTEAALAASRLPGWTVLRNHWYFENLHHSVPAMLSSGRWYSAAGDGRVADLARDDLARAAAVALSGATQGRSVLTLSGAKARTRAEIAAVIGRATGRSIEVVPVSVDALVQGMVSHGLPEPVARMFASFDENTAADGFGEVTGDYEKLTGRQPQSFEDWLEKNKAVWSAPAA